jgi:hypothetical protein
MFPHSCAHDSRRGVLCFVQEASCSFRYVCNAGHPAIHISTKIVINAALVASNSIKHSGRVIDVWPYASRDVRCRASILALGSNRAYENTACAKRRHAACTGMAKGRSRLYKVCSLAYCLKDFLFVKWHCCCVVSWVMRVTLQGS